MRKSTALTIVFALLMALIPVAPKAFAAAPVLTATGGSTAFVSSGNTTSTPVAVDSGITASDADNNTMSSATIAITGNLQSTEDVLGFSNASSETYGNISQTYDAGSGILRLTSEGATATLTQWQAALRAVTYTDTAVTPNTATRLISFTLVDSSGETSNTVAKMVTVAASPTPIVTVTGGTTTYASGHTAVVIDDRIKVQDGDNTTQSSARVRIISGFDQGDTLIFENNDSSNDSSKYGNINGSYNGTGVLTLTSSGAMASVDQWSSALSSVTFSTSSPNAGTRVIDFLVNDGSHTSAEVTDNVEVITLPGAPVIGSARAGDRQATVSFTPPANDGGNAITSYTVASNPGGVTATGAASPITVTGLTNGTAYTFTVTATNSAGTGAPSASSNSVTPRAPVVPGAPTDVTATAGNGEATVSFTPPANDGGSAITGYTVTSSPGGITATGSDSPIKVTGLANGTAYTFTVTAENAVGKGSASAESNSVTPSTVPGAPTDVTATAGNGEATVSFTPPSDDGGSAITGYTVTSSPGGITVTGTSSPITVTGLTNGTAYTFTVTATNAVGTGSASAESNGVTPKTVPGAPTDVTATAGNGEATVSFTPPADDGGSAITGYTVTSNPGGLTATGTASPITVTGLTNGTEYTFTVTAENVVGTGTASAKSNGVTPKTVPGAPTGVTATASNGEATVSFTPPADDGGSAITGYTVTSSPGGITVTGTSSPIKVTGLANGTVYTFTVTANNAAGAGSASTASNIVTPAAAAAPTASRPVIDLDGVSLDPSTVDLTKPSVTFDVKPKDGSAYVSIPASILSGFVSRNESFLIEIKAPYASYRVPVKLASLVPGLTDLLASHHLSADDISFKITLTDRTEDNAVHTALAAGLPNGTILGSVVDFAIQVVDVRTGQSIGSADRFDQALVRLIPMPEGLSGMPQDWGAFRYNEETKQFDFVPASTTRIDGMQYVAIRSYTNSTYLVADNPASFADVPEGHWAEPSVRVAAAKGLVQGVGEGHYAPSASVTRAEFAAMLVRALGRGSAGDGTGAGAASGYADVQPGSWYYEAVAKAKELGLLGFAGGSRFEPDQALTREEMAGMLAAAVKLEQPTTAPATASLGGYRDADSVDADRLEDIRLMVQLGIMTGTSANTLNPQGTTTRGQAAVVFVRTLRALGLIDS